MSSQFFSEIKWPLVVSEVFSVAGSVIVSVVVSVAVFVVVSVAVSLIGSVSVEFSPARLA